MKHKEFYKSLLHQANLLGFGSSSINDIEGLYLETIIESPLKTEHDLIRTIHMVYAWMPTMLNLDNFTKVDINAIFLLALRAKNNQISEADLRRLIIGLSKITNNHFVGASKVLFILNRDVYPIIDSRVIRAWNSQNKNFGLKKIKNISVMGDENFVANEYLMYKNLLTDCSRLNNVSIREIEILLFYIGKK